MRWFGVNTHPPGLALPRRWEEQGNANVVMVPAVHGSMHSDLSLPGEPRIELSATLSQITSTPIAIAAALTMQPQSIESMESQPVQRLATLPLWPSRFSSHRRKAARVSGPAPSRTGIATPTPVNSSIPAPMRCEAGFSREQPPHATDAEAEPADL
jgi:hypothetical protein